MGDIATEIGAGLRSDSKKLEALQKSHRMADGNGQGPRFCLGFEGEATTSGNTTSAFAVLFAVAAAETASARPKKHRVERSDQPAITLDEHGTPIIMQGLPKRPARNEDRPKERAERPRMIPRGSNTYIPPPVPSPSVPSPMLRQPTLAPYQPPPIPSVSDRVTQCLHSFPLNAGHTTCPYFRAKA